MKRVLISWLQRWKRTTKAQAYRMVLCNLCISSTLNHISYQKSQRRLRLTIRKWREIIKNFINWNKSTEMTGPKQKDWPNTRLKIWSIFKADRILKAMLLKASIKWKHWISNCWMPRRLLILNIMARLKYLNIYIFTKIILQWLPIDLIWESNSSVKASLCKQN